MKKIAYSSLLVMALAMGCSNDKKTETKTALTDLQPQPAAQPTHPVQVTSVPVGMAPTGGYVDPGPVAVYTPPASSSGAGRQYTVKKGDTLWGIASRTYGDGKQHTRIVAANPAIKGTLIREGQVITLPN